MADFDLRDLTDDEDDASGEYSFDDMVDDDDEFTYGQEIGEENEFAGSSKPGPLNKYFNDLSVEIGRMTSQQRLILSAMLFGNVLILSIGALLVTGRIG